MTASRILAESACDLTWRNFSELEGSYAFWSASTEAFLDHLAGDDLGSSESFRAEKSTGFTLDYSAEAARKHVASSARGGRLLHGACTKAAAVSGVWHTVQVGPFLSTGGYDWWTVYWRGINPLGRTPATITADVLAPVDSSGRILGLPPIHNHHVHLQPGWGGDIRISTQLRGMLFGHRGEHDEALGNVHGDYECPQSEGGVDCLGHEYAPRFGKEFDQPLSMAFQINDVRAAHSPPMVHYYQITLRVLPPTDRGGAHYKPLSVHDFANPSDVYLPVPGRLPTALLVPSDMDSFYIFSGRLPWGGVYVDEYSTFHAHQAKFQGALLAAATPADLGFDRPGFLPIRTASVGYASNADLQAAMVTTLKRKSNGRPWANERDNLIDEHAPPQVLCLVVGRRALVGDVVYDRVSEHSSCLNGFRFTPRTTFTAASFNGPSEFDTRTSTSEHESPSKITEFGGMLDANSLIADLGFPEHLGWFAH